MFLTLPGLRARSFSLHSELPPETCTARLESSIDHGLRSLVTPFTRLHDIVGSVSRGTIKLHKRSWGRNAFQTCLRATITADSGGTRISGTTGIHPMATLLVIVWIAFAIAASLGLTGKPQPDAFLFGLTIATFGLGSTALGLYLARNEAAYLEVFLLKTLEARDDSLA